MKLLDTRGQLHDGQYGEMEGLQGGYLTVEEKKNTT